MKLSYCFYDFLSKAFRNFGIMEDAHHKLKERVKELNCLYEISKVALEANNDVDALVAKTLQIIPAAMQYPELAETAIQISTSKF